MSDMPILGFEVPGVPQPQGSKDVHHAAGKMWTSESNKKVYPWRDSVIRAAREASEDGVKVSWHGVPVEVSIEFNLPRPKGHYGKRGLLPSAPKRPAVRPDLDKLVRGVLDALKQAGVIRDDGQVVSVIADKWYEERPSTVVQVMEATL